MLATRTADNSPEALVFPEPDGGYLRNGKWWHRSGWAVEVSHLGLTGVTPHDLRRSFDDLARRPEPTCA